MGRTYFKAPKYFVELMNEREQKRLEVADLLGVSIHWIEQAKDQAALKVIHQLTGEQKKQMEQLVTKGNLTDAYAWARLRYEKDDLADEILAYDDEKQIIKVKQDPLKKLIKTVKGVLRA